MLCDSPVDHLLHISYKPQTLRVSLTWLAIASTRVSGINVSEAILVSTEVIVTMEGAKTETEEKTWYQCTVLISLSEIPRDDVKGFGGAVTFLLCLGCGTPAGIGGPRQFNTP